MKIQCTMVPATQRPLAHLPRATGIVIPAYNEAKHLPQLIARCIAVAPSVIIVVDDGSTDGTAEIVESVAGRERTPVRLIRNARNLGKQGSVLLALRALRGWRLDAIALVDGDGQHDPRELPRMVALLDRYHFVIGARSRREMPPQRRLSNWLVNRGFELIGGVDFVDVQSGLRVYRKSAADVLSLRLAPDGGYSLEHESLAVLAKHAQRMGVALRVAATPASCRYGEARSAIGPAEVALLAWQTLRQAFRIRRALSPAHRVAEAA